MRVIHLLRHAKSSWDEPGLKDFDRPLNERGRRAAQAMARHLRKTPTRPSLVLCSSAARTRETYELLAPSLGGAPVRFEDDIYEADAATLMGRLQRLPAEEPGPVLLIGHNPGLERLALLLAAEENDLVRRMAKKYPTGALATLESDIPSWADIAPGSCRVSAFVRPKDLA